MFKKGDPKPPGSGRKEGTPNKDKPLKALVSAMTMEYMAKPVPLVGPDGQIVTDDDGKVVCEPQFAQDLRMMSPADRAKLMAKFIDYLMPKLQAITADVSSTSTSREIADRVRKMSGEQ